MVGYVGWLSNGWVSTVGVSCDVQGDLTPGFQHLKCHLDIFCRSQRNQVSIIIPILHSQRAIISSRSTKSNLPANSLHEVTVFGGKGDLNNEDIFVEVDFDFYVRIAIGQVVKPLRPRAPEKRALARPIWRDGRSMTRII